MTMFGKHQVRIASERFVTEFKEKRVQTSCGLYIGPNGTKYFFRRTLIEKDLSTNEIAMMLRLSSQFVQRLDWIWVEKPWMFLFFEWVDYSLQELLNQRSSLTIDECRRIYAEMLRSLVYLEESGIVHRNIKPASVLLTSVGKVKLTNFSVAILLKGCSYVRAQPAGCYLTIPPEADEEIVSPAWDVWSATVVLYVMLTGLYPFQPAESSYPMRDAIGALFSQIKDRSFLLDVVGLQSGSASMLLERIFNSFWRDRPSARDVLRFEFVDSTTSSVTFVTYILKKLIRYRLEGRNKIMRTPVCFACVVQRIKEALKTRTTNNTEKETSVMSAASPDTSCDKHLSKEPLWIVHWADFTHRFGFCVTFSNGCTSVLFNDLSTITSTLDGTTHYFEKDGQGWRFQLRKAPRVVRFKIAYLQWWRKETGAKASNQSAPTSGLRNWWRTEAGMALTFDGILQFDFIDGTRLVLSPSHILKFPKDGGCQLHRWKSPLNPSALWDQIAHLDTVVDKINENFPGNFQ